MTEQQARFIVKLTISPYLPAFIGRRRFWHRLFYRAAHLLEVQRHHEAVERYWAEKDLDAQHGLLGVADYQESVKRYRAEKAQHER